MQLNRFFWPAVACVIAIAGTLEVSSALGETQTWDEGIHIAAGYAYLTRGDYRWNDEHPPLAKIIFGISILPAPETPLLPDRPTTASPDQSLPRQQLRDARTASAIFGWLSHSLPMP